MKYGSAFFMLCPLRCSILRYSSLHTKLHYISCMQCTEQHSGNTFMEIQWLRICGDNSKYAWIRAANDCSWEVHLTVCTFSVSTNQTTLHATYKHTVCTFSFNKPNHPACHISTHSLHMFSFNKPNHPACHISTQTQSAHFPFSNHHYNLLHATWAYSQLVIIHACLSHVHAAPLKG